MNLEAIVIWGHSLHSHTHSYIHNAFNRAFTFLKYKCYWVDHRKSLSEQNMILPQRCLYITEGCVSNNIILDPTSYYVLHNCDMRKYVDAGIPENHIIGLQVFTKDCIPRCKPLNDNKFIRFDGKVLYMPWATDLYPHEIDENIKKIEEISRNHKPICHFVGMFLENPWGACREICGRNGISFSSTGGFSGNNITIEENMRRVQESIIAPSFQESWQTTNSYIPCRIFKNISYGKMGITNNEAVQELFNGRLIFNTDVRVATQTAIDAAKQGINIELLKELMLEVRNKHTYINRIEDIFTAFTKL